MERKIKVKALQNSNFYISLNPSDVIDQGSFAKVVKAFNKQNLSEQLVAKIISCKNEEKAQTIKSQIIILKKIPYHLNLVNCRKVQLSSQNNFYLIMQYCNGGNLEQYINKNKKKITEQDIQNVMIQFCAGYKVLYENHIIHRDIKPQNIMFHNKILKIADFGFAKITQQNYLDSNMSMKGTPLYMAPQVKFQKEGSAKVDMFSFGTVIYRLAFQGIYPYYDPKKNYRSSEQYFNQMINKKLIIPENKRSKQLIDLIKKMLTKEKQKRISWQQLFAHPYISKIQIKQKQINPQRSKLMPQHLFLKKIQVQNHSVILPSNPISDGIQDQSKNSGQQEIQITILQNILQKNKRKSDIHKILSMTKYYYTLIQHTSKVFGKLYKSDQNVSQNFKVKLYKIIVAGLEYSLQKIKQLQDLSGDWQLIKSQIQPLQNIFKHDRQVLNELLLNFTKEQKFIPKQYQEYIYDLLIEFTSYKQSVKKAMAYSIRQLIDIYDFVNGFVSVDQQKQNVQNYIIKVSCKPTKQMETQIKDQLKKRGLSLV